MFEGGIEMLYGKRYNSTTAHPFPERNFYLYVKRAAQWFSNLDPIKKAYVRMNNIVFWFECAHIMTLSARARINVERDAFSFNSSLKAPSLVCFGPSPCSRWNLAETHPWQSPDVILRGWRGWVGAKSRLLRLLRIHGRLARRVAFRTSLIFVFHYFSARMSNEIDE